MNLENSEMSNQMEYESGIFSMDTRSPRINRVIQLGSDQPFSLMDIVGVDETAEVLEGKEELPFGKFEVERTFDSDGNLADWAVYLYPLISDEGLRHLNHTLDLQKTREAKEKLTRMYEFAVPITQITPDNGIVMSFPNNSLHIERNRNYVKWSNGTEHQFVGQKSPFEDVHYKVGNGITMKAIVPDSDGKPCDMYFEGDVKYLSVGISGVLEGVGNLMQEEVVDQAKIRLLVNSTLSVSQQPSGGSLIQPKINK